jgi:O-antigen/teichoic acid export membrane protein
MSGLAVVVFRRADQLLLAGLASSRELARYAAAVSVVEALNVVPVAVATVALPALAQRHSRSQRESGGISRMSKVGYRMLGSFVLPLAALGTVWGRHAMGLLYGPAYRVSGPALAVLLWAAFFGFVGVLLQQVLVARNQLRELAILVVCGAALNVALNLWAIPRYGGLGAAWTSLIAYSVPFVIGSFVGAGRDAFRECFRGSVRPAVAAGTILLILLAARPLGAFSALLFGLVAPAALLITGSTSVAEVRLLAGRVASRRTRPRP